MDASAAVAALLNEGDARTMLAFERLAAPHLVDAEIAQALRRQAIAGKIAADDASRALRTWSLLGVDRYPGAGLHERVWALRHNLTADDATYVALAEALEAPLVTADAKLAASTGPSCAITVVRS